MSNKTKDAHLCAKPFYLRIYHFVVTVVHMNQLPPFVSPHGDGWRRVAPLVFLTFLPFSHGFGGHLPQTIDHWSDPLPFPRHKNNQVRHNVWYETNMWKHNMKNDIRPSVGHFQVGQCMSHAYTLDKRIKMIQNAWLWTSPRVPKMTCYFLMKCSLLRCLSSFGTVSLSKMFNHESSSLSLSACDIIDLHLQL